MKKPIWRVAVVYKVLKTCLTNLYLKARKA